MIVNETNVNNLQLLKKPTFTFEIDSLDYMDNVEIMYSIYNQQGLLVLSSNSKFSCNKPISLNKGKNIFKVKYDEFPLSCGIYKINLRIRDKYEKDIDWIENAYRFDIVEDDIFGTGKFYRDSSSIMMLPYKWIL